MAAGCTVSSKQVKRSVEAIYELLEKKSEKSSNSKYLFEKDPSKISVRIQLKKSPAGNQYGWKEIKVVLSHCPFGNKPKVCLFVKDLRKGRKAEDELVIEYFKDVLSKKEITSIDEIIPTHILRSEYNSFKTKKNLSENFDKFITDERIKMTLPTLLGKWFIERKKLPIPVNLTKSTTKSQVDKALRSTIIPVLRNKFIYHVHVGNNAMDKSETVSNILDLLNQLANKIPGGWENIRSIFLSTTVKPSIPVYVSLSPACDVKLISKNDKLPKAEELSTLPRKKVRVLPDGTVNVLDGKKNQDMFD